MLRLLEEPSRTMTPCPAARNCWAVLFLRFASAKGVNSCRWQLRMLSIMSAVISLKLFDARERKGASCHKSSQAQSRVMLTNFLYTNPRILLWSFWKSKMQGRTG